MVKVIKKLVEQLVNISIWQIKSQIQDFYANVLLQNEKTSKTSAVIEKKRSSNYGNKLQGVS